jgi:hypothetical protein
VKVRNSFLKSGYPLMGKKGSNLQGCLHTRMPLARKLTSSSMASLCATHDRTNNALSTAFIFHTLGTKLSYLRGFFLFARHLGENYQPFVRPTAVSMTDKKDSVDMHECLFPPTIKVPNKQDESLLQRNEIFTISLSNKSF